MLGGHSNRGMKSGESRISSSRPTTSHAQWADASSCWMV